MDKHPAPLAAATHPASFRQIDSKLLLGSEGRVVILHQGQHYVLRQTQAGKLILTK
ncbi:Hemin transporter HemP [Paramixta manurensis]|uniref:Hemin transporter HemP n=1 Tax=Paramixta manurensis TaxID=2740817 RepID=A0A6M8UJJ1_9GAMM|nr:Hemin transporter HemP [Erwiniaceae bacterium PD-1]